MAASFTKKYYLLPIWGRNKTIVELKTVAWPEPPCRMESNDKHQWAIHLSGVRVSICGLKRTVVIVRLCKLVYHRARWWHHLLTARFLSMYNLSSFSGLNNFLFVFPIKLISWVSGCWPLTIRPSIPSTYQRLQYSSISPLWFSARRESQEIFNEATHEPHECMTLDIWCPPTPGSVGYV